MSDDLDALLREHYRRAADGVQPDAELMDRFRRAGRPTRAVRSWPRMLLAAAAVVAIALVAWSLSRPDHPGRRGVPMAPPPATTVPSPPMPSPSPLTTRPTPRLTKPARRAVPVPPSPRPTGASTETPHPSATRRSPSTPRPTRP
ncbi:hypothetical protein NE236_27630 [Actinoallomurus purpureus]|uniref:hypothetical protein n=1 Tax=Actinoallomurus purpureus TaxID=478114 RepID=UPI002092B156|nr:hypothetical protein [Actinoallomurus purpureus]MCO6008751.1 hypothetical protein [Actinoallomurus purpureus]